MYEMTQKLVQMDAMMKFAISLTSFCCCFSALCAWENDFKLETGYRLDSFKQSGAMVSPSFRRFKQEIPSLGMYQVDLEDRWMCSSGWFFKGMAGVGFCFHTQERARGTIDLLVPPLTPNETPKKYDVQADPYDFYGEDIYKQKETMTTISRVMPSKQVQHLYTHKHGGASTWMVDLSVGAALKVLECQSLEPRLGYVFQGFKASHVTSSCFQGIYVGLAMPIVWGNLLLTPDISYIFCGKRDENIDYFCQFGSCNKRLHVHQGRLLGFRGSIALDYIWSCHLRIGLIWKYMNLHTGTSDSLHINKAVSWKPHTEWQSQQILAAITYVF